MNFFRKHKTIIIKSVLEGRVKELASLKDGVFSQKMLGEGVVIAFDKNGKKGHIYAPISGRLLTAFPTGHAYGIRTKDGKDILIHIGIDTVNLKGEGFTSHVKQGSKIKQGAIMATVDFDYVRKHAPSSDVIVLVTSGEKIKIVARNKVEQGDVLFTIN